MSSLGKTSTTPSNAPSPDSALSVVARAAAATLERLGFEPRVIQQVLHDGPIPEHDDALVQRAFDIANSLENDSAKQEQPWSSQTKTTPRKNRALSNASRSSGPCETGPEHPKKKFKKGQSLSSFFGGSDHRVPPVFELVWPPDSVEPIARFVHKVPPGAHVVGDIKWRAAKRNVTLCCTNEARLDGWDVPRDKHYDKSCEQLLKSHIQKCVRRSLVEEAVDTAVHLARVNLSELLQRLGVIIIEDVVLFEGFEVLVWLMAAELKGFTLRREHVSWVLGVVAAAARCSHRDRRSTEDDFDLLLVSKKLKLQHHKTLLYSLVLRRDYKCMTGDKLMFNAAAKEWMKRFESASTTHILKWQIDPLDPINGRTCLTPDRWCLAGVDFHCTDIADQIEKRCKIPIEQLRTIIWECSSSITNKYYLKFGPEDRKGMSTLEERQTNPACAADFKKIEPIFNEVAKTILRGKFQRSNSWNN